MTGFAIRRFQTSDAPHCARIFDRAWHAGHPYAPRVIDETVLASETAEEAQFVAVGEDGTVVGFVSLYEPQAFVHHLYVEPALRGRGIGKALLEHAVAAVGGRATLKCQIGNERAMTFYRRLGWIEVTAGTGEFGAWVAMRSPS